VKKLCRQSSECISANHSPLLPLSFVLQSYVVKITRENIHPPHTFGIATRKKLEQRCERRLQLSQYFLKFLTRLKFSVSSLLPSYLSILTINCTLQAVSAISVAPPLESHQGGAVCLFQFQCRSGNTFWCAPNEQQECCGCTTVRFRSPGAYFRSREHCRLASRITS